MLDAHFRNSVTMSIRHCHFRSPDINMAYMLKLMIFAVIDVFLC